MCELRWQFVSTHCDLKLASWQGLKVVAAFGRVKIVN